MENKKSKIVHTILKLILALILLIPIFGILGIFPEPTRDLYNTDIAFEFIDMLYETKYINYIIAIVFVTSIVFLFAKREDLAALLIAPITVNIISFHLFLDGIFTSGAIMGSTLFLLNIYFLWKNKESYKRLWEK